MPRAIKHTKLRAPSSVFSPHIRRVLGLQRPNQPSIWLVEAGTLGFSLAVQQVMPAFHEVPQQFAHIRLQAHSALPASQNASRAGLASSSRSRAKRRRIDNRTRSSNRVECQVWIGFVTGSLCHGT